MASTSSRSRYSSRRKPTSRAAKSTSKSTVENAALNYRFHIILAKILQNEGVTLQQLDEKLNEDLDNTAPNRFQRSAPHQKMNPHNTLQRAREKTNDEHYLMSYLLDRWSRVTGGDRKPYVLERMFEHKPRIGSAINELCELHLEYDWSKCGKKTPMQLEINSEGTLFTICRGCAKRSKQKCQGETITQGKIRSLLQNVPTLMRPTRKRSLNSKTISTCIRSDSDELSVSDVTPRKKQKTVASSTAEERKDETDDVIIVDKVVNDTAEYKTIIKCTVELITAVRSNITALSGHLLSNDLITSNNDTDLRDTTLRSELDRAAKLVELVRCKVQLSPDNFHKFTKVLEGEKESYEDIIIVLRKTLDSFKEGSSSSVGRRRSLKAEKEKLMDYLSEHISEEDCTVLKDSGILSFELLYLLSEEDVKQLHLTIGGKKFITNEIAKQKQSAL